ncbi:DUF3429 domain-containing protein [Erythrobacter sp. SD-21]|uniref:DUF3429 domain-containing protein n=1 Tax=Erythrobacter sp. SD-21 TaxID=161528 RepID=UPI000153EF84|nr:DUF3429 domain-containing protein [Erythrobacter sp. SD-21]EDL49234.1 hypothetical protein ED21_21179 [Erythrobacter sp. SD-21]
MGKVPLWPRLLGLAGLLPQFVLLGLAYLGTGPLAETAGVLAAFYAALIFTFLGGTWWGIAAGAPAAERRDGLGWLWVAAVVPSLLALAGLGTWAIELIPLEPLLVMLGAGLLMALVVDMRIGSLGPRWWLGLRAPLSLGLGLATLAIAFA